MSMRRAYDSEILMVGETFIGINLGADYTAEHERGIGDIRSALGIPSDLTIRKLQGIKGRTITKFDPKRFFFEKGKTHTCLTFEEPFLGKLSGWKNCELESSPKELATAWSWSNFGIVVVNNYAHLLEELYEAFKCCDVAISLGGSTNPFQNGGLSIVIASKFPKEANDSLKAQDEDRRRLVRAVDATGIVKRLKAAKKEYSALSPRWKDEKKKEVMFWLNPYEQRENKCGWFTVKDLDLWIQGKGKIPMKRKKNA